MPARPPLFLSTLLLLGPPVGAAHASDTIDTVAEGAGRSLWVDGIGSGYVKRARFIDLEFTRGFGSASFGSDIAHDLLLGRIAFSESINNVWAVDRWYGGNLFLTAEFMGGVRDNPDQAYLAFGNLGVRYEFATRGRFIPFVDAALGAGATAIAGPDLSEGIQFTQQIGFGLRYFVTDRFNLTGAAGYMHISNASIRKPNGGVNTFMLSFGAAWGF